MIPTPRLRFVERLQRCSPDITDSLGYRPNMQMVKILQQWWETGMVDEPVGEWRDVPVEAEVAK